MTNKRLIALAAAGLLGLPLAAQAQGTLRGAAEGAETGAAAAGPVGGIVGGAVGAATGTVGGILGVDDRPRFRSYVRDRGERSYSWGGPVGSGPCCRRTTSPITTCRPSIGCARATATPS